ncbi:cytochrome C-554, partial [candidate division KSB1 bacterium]|nr:cytochrome C-554 [candidate division KSB1 bacterium]
MYQRNQSFLTIFIIYILIFSIFPIHAEARKKKPNNYKMKYVGATKCNGSCHDAYYQAWKNTGHGKAFDILKPGARAEAKKKAGLDAEKDYTSDPNCLRCHTTGYRQR